jgi:integrase/recombinase XerD
MDERWRGARVEASLRVPMSTHKSTKTRRDHTAPLPTDTDSMLRFAELLKLKSFAGRTQVAYLSYIRALATRTGRDPATLSEEDIRAHILRLKDESNYAPTSLRGACAALRLYYNDHLGNSWAIFSLVRCPDRKTLPEVLTRKQLADLFSVIRRPRFRTLLRLTYACGLRVGEVVKLRIDDIESDSTRLRIRGAKGDKDRLVPLPGWALIELRDYWKTHRHPTLLFPGVGRGWRDNPDLIGRLATAVEPMGVGSVQICMSHARAEARLPQRTTVHTLRHSYATHLLEEGVSIRLISAYLGHSSLETTLIYTHLTTVNEAGARAALERMRPPLAL